MRKVSVNKLGFCFETEKRNYIQYETSLFFSQKHKVLYRLI